MLNKIWKKIYILLLFNEGRKILKMRMYAMWHVPQWFGHVERMDDYRISRRVLMAEVSGGQVRWRPRLSWMDGVKVALGNRGMIVEAAQQWRLERVESPGAYVTEWVSSGHFAWHCVLSDCPHLLWWLSQGEGRDAVTWCGCYKL